MKYHMIAMIVIVSAMVVLILMNTPSIKKRSEAFTNSATATGADCPVSAERGPDGHIHVQPGDKKFKTLVEYTNYLSELYTNGATCIPPRVGSNKEPVQGIRGGLGSGVQKTTHVEMEGPDRTVLNTNFHNEELSAKSPINKLDDYEYTRVFEVERGSRNKLDAESKGDLLRKRATDWAILPFNSEHRAKQEDEFIAGRMESGIREPKTGVLFADMEAKSVEPPDVEAARMREQKILAAYRPTDISRHIVDNDTEAVARLVIAEYGNDKNWEPVVEKVGENQWQVTELRPKPRTESYENDAATKNISMVDSTKTHLPRPQIDIVDRMQNDPYFDKRMPGGNPSNFWNYNDFKEWTPGLERMFAPTADNKAWY